ncbi:MAG: YdiU family protein [Myxococcota bacterium]
MCADALSEHLKSELRFFSGFTTELPADSNLENYPRQVVGSAYSHVMPTPVRNPKMLSFSDEVRHLLGVPEEFMDTHTAAQIFSGNVQTEGMTPFAAAYGGHQFGHWAGQLGDGRAITLGELEGPSGRFEVQLKGAGPTPYSRTADGRAVLRSSIREYLMSEAMHHLGIPTTRALCLVATGEEVPRDMFYTGDVEMEPGAIVCRTAPSFLRFGNFELFASRGDHKNLRLLADYAIRRYAPEVLSPSLRDAPVLQPETYLEWFRTVAERTATMVVHWMRVGFVHGVMNTDNMSILGLTIDYGPYGVVDQFDLGWTPNTTDAQGRRYRFGNQPQIAFWNLLRFAEAILPLIGEKQPIETLLAEYPKLLEKKYREAYLGKLGLEPSESDDEAMLEDLHTRLAETEIDMTLFFRLLADIDPGALQGSKKRPFETIERAYYEPPTRPHRQAMSDWLDRYMHRAISSERSRAEQSTQMRLVNPKYVLRNYMAQIAIDKATEGDMSLIKELLELLRHPYDEQPEQESYFDKRPDWARDKPGCSMLSCSS